MLKYIMTKKNLRQAYTINIPTFYTKKTNKDLYRLPKNTYIYLPNI